MAANTSPCPRCGGTIYLTDDQCLSCGARLDAGRLVEAVPGAVPAVAAATEPMAAVPYQTSPLAQPWDPRELGHGGGFFDRLSRGFGFLKQAVALLGRDWRLLVPSALSVLFMLVLVGIALGIIYLTGNWGAFWAEEAGSTVLFWATGIPLALLTYLVSYFFQGITVNLVNDLLHGKHGDMGAGLGDSLKNLPALATLAGVSVLVSLVAGAVRGRGGWGRRAAADAMESAWRTAVLLTLPIVILEDRPMIQAFGRAKDLHARHLGEVLVAWFGVGLVNRLVGFVVVALAIGGGVLFYLATPALLPVAIGMGLVGILLASIFTAYLNTAYYTCLYLWAAATETAEAAVPAPAPLAAVAW